MTSPTLPEPTAAELGAAAAQARRAGRHDEAVQLLDRAIAAAPGSFPLRIQRAQTLREAGRTALACASFEHIASEAGAPISAHIGLAECRFTQGEVEAALQSLRELHQRHPGDLATVLVLCDQLCDLRRFEEAEQALDGAAPEHARHPGLVLRRGRCARQRGQPERALEHFETALLLAPGDPGARLARAELLLETGRPDPALEELERLRAERPDAREVQLAWVRAQLQIRGRGTEQADAQLMRWATDPGLGAGRALELGYLAQAWGRAEPAIALFHRALGDPRSALAASAAQALCVLLAEAGRHQEVVDLLAGLADEISGRPALLLRRMEAHQHLGQEAQARKCLHRVEDGGAALGPDVLALLSQFALREGDLTAAKSWAGQAMAAAPDHLEAQLTSARLLDRDGWPEVAQAMLGQAQHRSRQALEERPELALCRSQLLRARGRVDEAQAVLADALPHVRTGRNLLHLEAARCAIQGGAVQDATAHLQQVRAQHLNEEVECALARAGAADALAQHAGAWEHCLAATRLKPGSGSTWHQLAIASAATLRWQMFETALDTYTRLERPIRRSRGLPMGRSQSHLGLLFDEYMLDPAVTQQAADCVAGGGPVALNALARLLLEHPGQTAPAVGFVQLLRGTGLMDEAGDLPSKSGPLQAVANRIPARITQFWHESRPPADVLELMQEWKQLHPGHEYRRFDDHSARVWLRRHARPEVLEAYEHADQPAKQSDLFRLAVLWHEGGWYADADDRCRRPLDDRFSDGRELLLWHEPFGTMGNNFIGARARHPVIGTALRAATAALLRGDDDMVWLSTGPALMTRQLALHLAPLLLDGGLDRLRAALAPIGILTPARLAQYVVVHCNLAYKQTSRHWNAALAVRKRGQTPKQDGEYPPYTGN